MDDILWWILILGYPAALAIINSEKIYRLGNKVKALGPRAIRAESSQALAERLTTAVFCEEQVTRIALKSLQQDGSEVDMGGLCREAVTSLIKLELEKE